MKINRACFLRQEGVIFTRSGLSPFVEGGIWSADDRILVFCNQESGGLSALIYHGKQPQSANAYLLRLPGGALKLSLLVEAGDRHEIIPHRFQHVSVWPYGWKNEFQSRGLTVHSWLCVQGGSLVWQVQVSNRREVAVSIAPRLALDPLALSTQVNGCRVWTGPETWHGGLRLKAHDQLQTSTWINTPGFKDVFINAETILLISTSDLHYSVAGLALNLAFEKILPGSEGRANDFLVVCGSSEEQVTRDLDRLSAAPDRSWQEQSTRYISRSTDHPVIQVRGFPFAAAVYDLAPLYAEAASVTGTGALRSSAGGYYFVWGWDSLMGGHELARWGDPQGARRLLDFMAAHRAPDGSIPHRFDNDLQPLQVTGFGFTSLLYISLLYQYYSETEDRELLDRAFPIACKIFEAISAISGESGFYPSLGMYPDAPLKLGRTDQSYVSYEIGFWYCVCRMMEILANLESEGEIAKSAARLAERIEVSFLKVFFDPERGFLVDSVSGQGWESNGTYPRYALFPLHNTFGACLLSPVIKDISRFIQQEFFGEDGIRMVPGWDPHAGTETVTSDCWFLHFDLYCLKAFRRAGDGAAIERWLRLAQVYFSKRCAIPELQMMSPTADLPGDWRGAVGQLWQLFAMSGWTRGLLEGVLGLESDIGGLTYIPCPLSIPMQLHKLPFRGGNWKVKVAGEGAWVGRLVVDGRLLRGSLKVPESFYTRGDHDLEVVRSTHVPSAPCLLEAVGAAVLKSTVICRRLIVRLRANNKVNLVLYSPMDPQVFMDGKAVLVDWNPQSAIGRMELTIQGVVELAIG
jgi:hypothetical protein